MCNPITLNEAAQNYLEYLKQSGKSPRTIYTYGKDLEQIQAFFGPDKEMRQMTLSLSGRFLKSPELHTLANGNIRAEKTVQKTVRVFRLFLTWCYQEGVIDQLLLPKKIQSRVKGLSEEG